MRNMHCNSVYQVASTAAIVRALHITDVTGLHYNGRIGTPKGELALHLPGATGLLYNIIGKKHARRPPKDPKRRV